MSYYDDQRGQGGYDRSSLYYQLGGFGSHSSNYNSRSNDRTRRGWSNGGSSEEYGTSGCDARSGYGWNGGDSSGDAGAAAGGFDNRSRSGEYSGRAGRGYDTRDGCGYRGGGQQRGDRGCGATTGGQPRDDQGCGASAGSQRGDRGYGEGRGNRGHGGNSGGGRDDRVPRGGGSERRRDDHRGGDHGYGGRGDPDRGGGFGSGFGGRDRGGGGRGDGRGESGFGTATGAGYENIGEPIADPRLREEWTGRAGVREVSAEDPDLQQEFLICRRPSFARDGRPIQLRTNFFGVSLSGAPAEIFKYNVDVELSPDLAGERNGSREAHEERPLPRALVRNVINTALMQYEPDFGGIRVVHDGIAAVYAPAELPWRSKTFVDVNPDGASSTFVSPPRQPAVGEAPRRSPRGPRPFVVKMTLVEVILTASLTDYESNPDVNVMPVLQALDVVTRHLAAQRLVAGGRNFFSMKNTEPLRGGKELCWGYYQALRIADRKLVMNVDQVATVFYAPKALMELVLAALNARSPNDIRALSDRDGKALARALRKIEVFPTHRQDRKRAIFGISAQPANQTTLGIKGEEMSVVEYFSKRYHVQLKYPELPLVNVGGKRAGKESWLPIELCEVAPGQRCANISDLDTAEIIRQTSKPPRQRTETIEEQVHWAGFENDPFLGAFGVKVDQSPETTRAHVMDPPNVQYANTFVRPSCGQWNLRDKHLVDGAALRNWGVVVSANVGERDVQRFIRNLVDMASRSGLTVEDRNPRLIHKDRHYGVRVEELMKMCFNELEARNQGLPQLVMVVKQDKNVGSYADIKRMSDTVLGIPSQCIVAQNVLSATPQYCANVCLKMNMKLSGKNWFLREGLPFVSTAPTIIIGADVEHPRSGMGSRPSIAAVVASLDRYSAKYVARMAVQKASSDIEQLPSMLRDLFLSFYQSTNRKPERVVYYRDGVGEGQYFDILQAEMRALRMAFKMISSVYNPPVTFIIANKRHHLRTLPVNARDGDRKGNVIPGTVIDSGIVDRHRFNFYLYGHSGIQGTSVPCHYTVLHDENDMSPEDVQRLTYHLGYTFARCTRSVSVATPVSYARLAAARARLFLDEGSDGGSTVGSYNSSSSTFDFTGLHEGLKDCMFFI